MKENEPNNPKLVGSNVVDCIPQIGRCPNECLECFYNGGGFFRTKKKPLIPSLEEVGSKIVRVNSGHDSNVQKELVLKVTEKYKEKFYNTSLPDFDFPAPVVFTCNGRDTDYSALMVDKNLDNVMMVRFRTNLWNLRLLDEVIEFYTRRHKVPTTITFMRYTDVTNIPTAYRNNYVLRKSILNMYYCLSTEDQLRILDKFSTGDDMVSMCGLHASYCKDCKRCELTYNRLKQIRNWEGAIGSLGH